MEWNKEGGGKSRNEVLGRLELVPGGVGERILECKSRCLWYSRLRSCGDDRGEVMGGVAFWIR